jgi:hypothetical protein
MDLKLEVREYLRWVSDREERLAAAIEVFWREVHRRLIACRRRYYDGHHGRDRFL